MSFRKAFTLIELLVVIAIIAILAVVVMRLRFLGSAQESEKLMDLLDSSIADTPACWAGDGQRMDEDSGMAQLPGLSERNRALDPSATATSEGFAGSKIGFDATMPLMDKGKYAKTRMPDAVAWKIERLLDRYL